jgi:hypothetical protein
MFGLTNGLTLPLIYSSNLYEGNVLDCWRLFNEAFVGQTGSV